MEHPITPPPDLAAKWVSEIYGDPAIPLHPITLCLVERAAQWGADQELEACLRLVEIDAGEDAYDFARYIRAARRPKPPSLKESALNALEHILRHSQTDHGANTIRRALEALPND